MSPDRAERIANIIQKRRPLAQKIAEVQASIRSLSQALRDLQELGASLMAQIDDPGIAGRLQEVDFSKIQIGLAGELEVLSKLRARFDRDTLNIGVVGRARQGKSRLLQSITGLTAAEIPDGSRQHCTGVRSTIYHNPLVSAYGEVWFHSQRSFLDEVIAPYYEQLHLGAKPFSLDEFASQPLPSLPDNLVGAEVGAKYEHLRRYHKYLDKYSSLLLAPSPRRISQTEIREYVAQDTPEGDRVFFNYLAVREVKIVCTFPKADVGKISLVDMPGLGDTGIGDEERLIQTLGEEVDFVLFVRMPKSSGDYWADVDVKLYDTAGAALLDLPVKLWSFMILNQTAAGSNNGDNANNCQDLAETMAEKHLDTVSCVVANCAEAAEVNEKILDAALDYLADRIASLDRQYASACRERLAQLHSAINIEIEKAREALGEAMQRSREFPLFLRLFTPLWQELSAGLEGLVRQLGEEREAQNLEFKQQVEDAIAACRRDSVIPSLEEMEKRRDRLGGYPNAYYDAMNEIRAHLSQYFLSLDDSLRRAIENVKSQVTQVLISQGRLGGLSERQGSAFIEDIAAQIPADLTKLKLGFQILAEFYLSYRGLIQHRIRRHLDGLTPDRTNLKLSQTSPSAKEAIANLATLQAEALYNCETALEDLLCEPSQAAFAIVEEFGDRVLRAEGVKDEWQIFLEEVRADIWPTEFARFGERNKQRRDWLEAIERAVEANQLFEF